MYAAEEKPLYLKLFPQDDAEAIARLIEENLEKEPRIIEEWHAQCASSFGAHQALSEHVFREVYVPGLRMAYSYLWRRDAPGFVAFGRELGEQLARVGVPFAAFVAYMHFLRRSYAKVFGDEPDKVAAALTHIDAIHAYLVSICADGYHGSERTVPGVDPEGNAGEIGVDGPRHEAGRGRAGSIAVSPADAPLPTLEAAERTLIEATLRSTAGNKVHAARQLGISRTQLYVKMAKFGLGSTARRASRSRSA